MDTPMATGANNSVERSTTMSSTEKKSGDRRKGRGTPSLVPLDIARNSPIAAFIDVVEARRSNQDLILSQDNSQLLAELMREHSKNDTLRRHGLSARSKLLFCGPPGCGKTLTAEVLANQTGLDLLVVRLDALISSFLGETASNLRTVLQAAEQRPCILFFDEFDALARARNDRDGHGEMRRVVNSLLVMIEQFQGRGFLIAATNLHDTIDDALWRRFDDVLLFDRPDADQIQQLLALKVRNFRTDFDIGKYAEELKQSSYAEIDRICTEAMKIAVMSRRKTMRSEDFVTALAGEGRRKAIKARLTTGGP